MNVYWKVFKKENDDDDGKEKEKEKEKKKKKKKKYKLNRKSLIIDLTDLNLDYLYLSFITCTKLMNNIQLVNSQPIIELNIQ